MVVQVVLFETHHLDNGTIDGELPMQAFHHIYDFFDGGNNVNNINLGGSASNWFANDPGNCASNPNQIYCYQLAYVKKAVETLCHHENIIWEIANEPPGGHEDWIIDMAQQVDTVEKATPGCSAHKHLVMAPEEANLDLLSHRDVPGSRTPGADESPTMHYAPMRLAIANQFYSDGRPMIADNDCCFTPGSPELQRKKAWTALVAGAHPSLFQYTMEIENPATVQDRVELVGRTAAFLDLFDIDLLGMAPDDTRIQAGPGTLGWLLSRAGSTPLAEGIVYFFDGGSATISDLPATYDAWWFNPVDGTYSKSNQSSGSSFTTPDTLHDWVLYIDGKVPQSVTVDAIADAYVYEASPTTNYGTSSKLSIRYGATDFGRFSFLKFNLPSNLGTVTSAKLRIRTKGTYVSKTAVYKVNNMSWTETGITWNNWDQAGAVTYAPVRSNLFLAANTWHYIDVTPAVTGSGTLNLGFASGTDMDQDFYSRESAYKPQLRIERLGQPLLVVPVVADSFVSENEPATNFGTQAYLRIRFDPSHYGTFSFIKFQVPSYSGTLVSAKLRIRTQWTTIPSAAVYRTFGMEGFNEGTINWLNWDQMGTVSYTYLGTTGALAPLKWHEINVTNGGAESGSTLVLGLTTVADQSGLNFWSREASTAKPQLLLTYQP